MKSPIRLSFLGLGCLYLVSCYPVSDPRGPQQNPRPSSEVESLTSQDQQKIQEQRDRMKAAEKKRQEAASNRTEETSSSQNTTTSSSQPEEKKSSGYPFANPVPGKEGFVFSPFNNKLVDVRDIPSGTLVQDPTYPASEKKYFRVP